jgi:hypothetical protein
VTTRHLALAVIAALVLAAGVYLFVEVRSSGADVTLPKPEPAPAVVTVQHQEPAVAATDPPRQAEPTPHTQPRALGPKATVTAAPTMEREAPEPAIDEMMKANPKLDAIMDQANKAYDRQDFEEARAIAGKVLAKQPGNVRMLRIMVSSSCIDGDSAIATKYYPQLPKLDRDQMKLRCDRYGVTLTDPPQ